MLALTIAAVTAVDRLKESLLSERSAGLMS